MSDHTPVEDRRAPVSQQSQNVPAPESPDDIGAQVAEQGVNVQDFPHHAIPCAMSVSAISRMPFASTPSDSDGNR